MSNRSSVRSGCSRSGRTMTWPASLMSKNPAPHPSMLYSARAASIDQAGVICGVSVLSAMRVAILNSTRFSSRVEHLHSPAAAVSQEDLSLMQPAWHSLPEFDALGGHPETRPVLRARHGFAFVLPLVLRDSRLEIFAPSQRPALLRRPGADLAAALPRREVLVGFRRHRLEPPCPRRGPASRAAANESRAPLAVSRAAPGPSGSRSSCRTRTRARRRPSAARSARTASPRSSTVPSANAVGSGRIFRSSARA